MKIALIRMRYDDISVYPPLGLLYIAAFLKKHRNDEVKIFDNRLHKLGLEQLTRKLSEFEPEIVGISLMSIEAGNLYEHADCIKQALPNCRIIVGGPHSLSNHASDIQNKNIDAVVVGEGEGSFLELIEYIGKGGALSGAIIKGVAVRDENDASFFPGHREPMNIHELPLPAYEMIDFEPYFEILRNSHNIIQLNKRNMNVISSRGCPFGCSYCLNPFGIKYRMRTAEDFVDELIFLKQRYNIVDINIEDDAFNMSLRRAKKIFRLIIEHNLKLNIAFPNGVRADRIDEELVILMKKAGVYRIAFGVESAVPRLLSFINKRINTDKISRAIDLATRYNINTHGFFILGFPDETEEEMLQTISYALDSKLCTAHFALLTIFKGTKLSEYIEGRYGVKQKQSDGSYNSVNENYSQVPTEQIYRLQKKAYFQFLFSFRRIYRIFKTVPQKKFLFKQALVFLRRFYVSSH